MAEPIGSVRASATFDGGDFNSGVRGTRDSLRVLEGGFKETAREAVRAAEGMAQSSKTIVNTTVVATKKQIDMLHGLDRSYKSNSASSRAWAKELDRQAQSFDRLRGSLDPVFATSKRYEAVQEQVAAAVRVGAATQAEANIVLERAAKEYLGLVPAAEQAARAQEAAAAATRSARDAYEQTRASVDPLFASSKRYEAIQAQMAVAVRSGAVTQSEANRVLQLAQQKYLGVSAAANAATAPTRGFFSLFSKERSHELRNVSLQLNQIAQQGSVTGDYLGAAAIQAADIGSAFGVVGIAAGALVSVLGPVALGMLGGGKEAEKFSDRVDTLSAAVSDYKNFADLAASSTEELRERFGSAGERAAEVADFMQEFSRVDAVEKLDVAVEELTERFGGLGTQLVAIDDTRGFWASLFDNQALGLIEEYRNTMLVLRRELGITEDQAKAVVASLARLGAAEGSDQAVAAASALNEQFLAVFGTVGNIPPELRDVAFQTGLIALKAGEILTSEQLGSIEIARRVAASSDLVDSYTNQAALANAIASFGADSAQVEALKRDAALRAAEAMIEQEGLAGLTAERVRDAALAAFDAEVNSAAAAVQLRNAEEAARGLASAIAAAAGYSASLDDGVRVLQAEVDALRAGADGAVAASLEAKRVRAENLRDASVAAGELAVIADAQLAIDMAAIEAQGLLITEKNKLNEANRAATSAGNKAATAAEKASKHLAKEADAIRASLSPLDAYNQKLAELARLNGLLTKDEMARAMRNLNVELADSLPLVGYVTDALVDGLFNGFEDGLDGMARSFKNWLQQMAADALKNQIVVSLGLTGGGTVGGIAQTVGGGLGLLSGAGNLLGLGGSGILSGIGSGLGGVLSGGGIGTSFANLGGLVTGVSSGWGALGAALPALGIVAGGIALLSKAFGRKYKYSGIEGSFGAGGFDGQAFDFYKGGWFRSDKTAYRGLDAEFDAALDEQFGVMQGGLEDMAAALGLATSVLDDYTGATFKITTSGKSQAEIQEELAEQMGLAADGMADLLLGTEQFTRVGETSSETLARLGSSLLTVNDAMDLLGGTLLANSLLGGDMASDLVDLFGGLEGFTAATSAYWQAYYSEAERVETITRRLTEDFGDLGLSLPTSREAFRALIDSLDLTTSGGRELYAELIALSGALAGILPEAQAVSAAMADLIGGIGGEIGAQIDVLQDQQRAALETARSWYRASDSLRSLVRDIEGITLTREQGLAVNQARFNVASDLVKAGDLQAAQDLPALARAYLDSAKANAKTSLEYRRIAAQVQSQLNFAAGVSDIEGANDEVIADLYRQQIDLLNQLGTYLNNGALTAQEIDRMSSSISALDDAIRTAEAFSYDDLVGALDVAVALADDAPTWLRRLVDASDTGLRTTLDFIIRRDDLTPADRWIATNNVSQHVSTLDFVLRNDLDRETRRLALTTTGMLQRDLLLTLTQDLDPETRSLVLTQNSNLTRRVGVVLDAQSDNTIRRLNRLQDLIGAEGSGTIRLAGGVSFDPDGVFSGLTSATTGLHQPMTSLTSMLGQLRDTVEEDRISREAATLLAQGLAARSTVANSREEARDVRDQLRALFEANGVVSQGGNFRIENGQLVSGASSWATSQGWEGIMTALADTFGVRGGTLRERVDAVLAQVNDPIAQDRDALQALRQAYRELTGNVPAFARGTSFAPGGRALVGEEGPEVVDLPRGAVVHPYSQSKAMLDDSAVVSELRALRAELATLRAEKNRADFLKIRNGNDQLRLAEKADAVGVKIAE